MDSPDIRKGMSEFNRFLVRDPILNLENRSNSKCTNVASENFDGNG